MPKGLRVGENFKNMKYKMVLNCICKIRSVQRKSKKK